MAKIYSKSRAKFRVQFYLNKEVEILYKENKKLAKNLGKKIDFEEDFQKWFVTQNKQARDELEKLQPPPTEAEGTSTEEKS